MNLDMRSPLFYQKIEPLTEEGRVFRPDGETLLCYELNRAQSRSIEPQKDRLLERLVFAGQKTEEGGREEFVALPSGLYLFAQCRKEAVLNREEWLDMAIEQQKDGLWERNKLGDTLYVRFLYEDGAFVTQVFRTLA